MNDAHVAINIAITLSDGRPSAALILRAIELSGYALVKQDIRADQPAEQTNSAPPRGATKTKAQWPQVCRRCNKVREAEQARECDDVSCPFATARD